MYFKNFALDLLYFESFDSSTANIAKCKWNFIFNSIHPEYKENAINELNDELSINKSWRF
ncbi:hypothetical protein MXB_750 [Myxobolus squamalis]|nr:hypothetical protein MXB_750 [Myxobolus squamalis]